VGKTKNGKIYHHLWSAEEIDALLKEHGLGQPAEQDPDAMDT
jgi:20S proteasome subunit alpha 3